MPLMGPNGLEKGPCKLLLDILFINLILIVHPSLVWSGRVPSENPKPLIAIVDKHEHARRRRAWTRGFTTTALKGYESMVKNKSLQLIDTLASKNLKESVDLTQWLAFYAYVDPSYTLVLDHTERCDVIDMM